MTKKNLTYSTVIPVFVSSNILATAQFYKDVLELEVKSKHDDYLIMSTDSIELHFSKQPFVDKKGNNCACYIKTTNIQSLYEKCVKIGCVHSNGKLVEMPWGKEFAVIDPDFNLIKFIN